MLVGNLHALLGIQTGADTVENSMKFPQKLKKGPHFHSLIPFLEIYPKKY